MTFTHSEADPRTIIYEKVVKGFALASYKFKQAVSVVSAGGAWKSYFYRETAAALTAQSGNAIKGIPRGAEFPQASVSWEKVQSVIEKYGLEDNIPFEDLISNDIDVRDRTLMRIAEGVAKAVDAEIWAQLTENRTPVNIQNITVTEGYEWDTASAAIIDNLLQAKQKISEYNYDTSNLMCFVSPKDYRSIMNYLAEKGAQFPTIGADVANNGSKGRLAGIDLIESVNVTASYAVVVVPKRCATWRELVPLSTITKEDPYKSLTVRSVEIGVTQVTDPKAIVLISNTQA